MSIRYTFDSMLSGPVVYSVFLGVGRLGYC
jgi:hypothetical protein